MASHQTMPEHDRQKYIEFLEQSTRRLTTQTLIYWAFTFVLIVALLGVQLSLIWLSEVEPSVTSYVLLAASLCVAVNTYRLGRKHFKFHRYLKKRQASGVSHPL